MFARLRTALRTLHTDQSGQSLIIIALSMTVIVALAAFAIDTATWYQRHHQTQVVADSAALAAANCLANPGTTASMMDGQSVAACSSTNDTADAQTVAMKYAAANGVTITTGQVTVNTTSGAVTVSPSSNAPSFFANLFGIHSEAIGANAQAKYAPGSTACTTAAQNNNQCYAIYTSDQTCGSSNGWTTATGNGVSITINGAVHSQGSLNLNQGTYNFNGPITYSSGNCTYTQSPQAGMSGGTYTPTAGGNQPSSFWPLDYSTVFPACSTNGTYKCTGPNGTPSYCGNAAANYSFSSGSSPTGIYCAYGNGTVSNPATWTGSITFSNGASLGSSSSPVALTMIAGYINASSSTLYLKPATNASGCLIYAVDTNSAAGSTGYPIQFGNGTYSFSGAMFAPNGTINLSSTAATTAFLESKDLNLSNLSFTGNGPIVTGSSSSTSGSDSLSQ